MFVSFSSKAESHSWASSSGARDSEREGRRVVQLEHAERRDAEARLHDAGFGERVPGHFGRGEEGRGLDVDAPDAGQARHHALLAGHEGAAELELAFTGSQGEHADGGIVHVHDAVDAQPDSWGGHGSINSSDGRSGSRIATGPGTGRRVAVRAREVKPAAVSAGLTDALRGTGNG